MLDSSPPARPAKTDAELRTLAQDIYAGKVFTGHHLDGNDPDYIAKLQMVFTPIACYDRAAWRRFADPPPGLVYQYYGVDQSELAANGLPIFFSYRRLELDEWQRLKPMLTACADAEVRQFFVDHATDTLGLE